MSQWSIAALLFALLLPSGTMAARVGEQDAGQKAEGGEKTTAGQRAESGGQNEEAKGQKKEQKPINNAARLAFIRRAQVWMPTDVAAMDLRAGPQGRGAFAPTALVTCDYVKVKLPGATPKFDCAITKDDILKVRYGSSNGEVIGSVLASRLIWALGFGADRVYPVKVMCRGCSSDPWTDREATTEMHLFDPAAIERKPEGHEMKVEHDAGWTWPELARVDPAEGGATRAQRDALTLLAVLIQHTDSKSEQQRLLCLPGGMNEEGLCEKPFLMIHDVGVTFGHANFTNGAGKGSVNFAEWSKTPVWRDARACVGHISKSYSGTLGDPKISEEGRAFLSGLLDQLTDTQLHDLFEVARVEVRSGTPGAERVDAASVDDWVAAFKRKRAEIDATRCPS